LNRRKGVGKVGCTQPTFPHRYFGEIGRGGLIQIISTTSHLHPRHNYVYHEELELYQNAGNERHERDNHNPSLVIHPLEILFIVLSAATSNM